MHFRPGGLACAKMFTRFGISSNIGSVAACLFTLVLGMEMEAEALENSRGGLAAISGFDPNQSDGFRQWDLHLGGWLNAGFTVNPDQSDGNYNGTVSFSDRANELQLNQLYLFLERAAEQNSGQWGWGGRLDFVFGSDAFYTRSMGDPGDHWDSHLLHQRIYGIAFPQAYLDIFAPIGRGLRFKVGEFYTLVGNETVTAPENFFYSRSYAMQFGEPFSHTGVLANYALIDNLDLTAGAVTGSPFAGWDGSFEHHLENWGFVGGLNYSVPDTGTSLAITGTHGSLSEIEARNVSLYSVVAKRDIGKSWHVTLQHDYGWITKAENAKGAEWYGVVAYLTHDVNEQWSWGGRLEWFRDDDGARVGVPARQPVEMGRAANYYAATLGANWRAKPWLTIRPSLRYDYSDGWQAFDKGASDNQLLISSDIVLSF